MIILLRLLPVLIGLLCIIAAFVPGRRNRVAHPCDTWGIVVGCRTQPVYQHRGEAQAFAPVVRYTTDKGEITAVSRHYVPEWQYGYRTGDRVKIRYDTQQPDVFCICGSGRWRRGMLMTVGIGTILAYGVLWVQYH